MRSASQEWWVARRGNRGARSKERLRMTYMKVGSACCFQKLFELSRPHIFERHVVVRSCVTGIYDWWCQTQTKRFRRGFESHSYTFCDNKSIDLSMYIIMVSGFPAWPGKICLNRLKTGFVWLNSWILMPMNPETWDNFARKVFRFSGDFTLNFF